MKVAIIGGGNLGVAIALGLRASDSEMSISISRRNVESIRHLELHGIELHSSNSSCVNGSDLVILAVKPHQVLDVLRGVHQDLDGKALVSVAGGISIASMKEVVGGGAVLFRAMPNTAIAVRQSMTCLCAEASTDAGLRLKVEQLFSNLGMTVWIEEKLFDAATVLGSCGVAYALRYIRASMQAGIQIGFDSRTALQIAAQTVNGAAELLLQNGTHPESEIDKVTTPQGCTIVGLNEMEHQGFSSSLIRGIQTSYDAIGNLKK